MVRRQGTSYWSGLSPSLQPSIRSTQAFVGLSNTDTPVWVSVTITSHSTITVSAEVQSLHVIFGYLVLKIFSVTKRNIVFPTKLIWVG